MNGDIIMALLVIASVVIMALFILQTIDNMEEAHKIGLMSCDEFKDYEDMDNGWIGSVISDKQEFCLQQQILDEIKELKK